MDENSPIYADETETVVFRVKDYRQVIEAHYQLPVKELVFEGESPYPEWASDQPELQPERAWFFLATFQTPQGEKEAEVEIGVKGSVLQVYHPVRPNHKVFNEQDRKQAKEDIPDLTFDYIVQLERTGRMAWQLWKVVFDSLHNIPDHRLKEVEKDFQKPLKWFFRDFERVGLLLPDGNTPLTAPKHEEG